MSTNLSQSGTRYTPNVREPNRLAYDTNNLPYIIAVTGHFSAGKDSLSAALRSRMAAYGSFLEPIINYKTRGPTFTELGGIDYRQVSREDFDVLVANGEIITSSRRGSDTAGYDFVGIPRELLESLKRRNPPILMCGAQTLVALLEYARTQQIPNQVMSLMLHTTKEDAGNRLLEKTGAYGHEGALRDLRSRQSLLDDEFELFRHQEHLFRHVFRNRTLDGVGKHEAIEALANRVLEILELERELNETTTIGFRRAYVDTASLRLFNANIADLIANASSHIPLNISDDAISKYCLDKGIDKRYVKGAVNRKTLGASINYGVLTVHLEPNTSDQSKGILTDLIAEACSLTPQSVSTKISAATDSRHSLTRIPAEKAGLLDFVMSFSPYDPMRTPRSDAQVHTLALESRLICPTQKVEPLPFEDAKRYVEGNGFRF